MLSMSECSEINRNNNKSQPAKYMYISGDNYPKANIQTYFDDGQEYAFVEIAIPGIDPKMIELAIEDGILSIRSPKVEQVINKVVRKDDNYGGETEYKLRELHQSSFLRKFDFNKVFEIDEKNIGISYNLGMLFIILPSVKEPKNRAKKVLDWWKKGL